MSEENNNEKVEYEGFGQKVKAEVKSLNTLATLGTLILCVLIAYVLWTHEQNNVARGASIAASVKEQNTTLKEAVSEMVTAQREATQTQRQLNCLISIDQAKREAEYTSPNSFCNRVSR